MLILILFKITKNHGNAHRNLIIIQIALYVVSTGRKFHYRPGYCGFVDLLAIAITNMHTSQTMMRVYLLPYTIESIGKNG